MEPSLHAVCYRAKRNLGQRLQGKLGMRAYRSALRVERAKLLGGRKCHDSEEDLAPEKDETLDNFCASKVGPNLARRYPRLADGICGKHAMSAMDGVLSSGDRGHDALRKSTSLDSDRLDNLRGQDAHAIMRPCGG